MRLWGVWSQAVGFVLLCLAGMWFSRYEDVFVFNLLKRKFHKPITFSASCTKNPEITAFHQH
jgi:hypothetical protein